MFGVSNKIGSLPSGRYKQVTMNDDGISYKKNGETKFMPGNFGGIRIEKLSVGASISGRNVANMHFSSSKTFSFGSKGGMSISSTTDSDTNDSGGETCSTDRKSPETFKNQSFSTQTFAEGSSISGCSLSKLHWVAFYAHRLHLFKLQFPGCDCDW